MNIIIPMAGNSSRFYSAGYSEPKALLPVGGTKMIEKESTRKSQVIHYHFNNSDFYYNPGFSDPKKGLYIKRKLDIVRS